MFALGFRDGLQLSFTRFHITISVLISETAWNDHCAIVSLPQTKLALGPQGDVRKGGRARRCSGEMLTK